MVNHSALCRSINYDYMNILTWTILKKTQILNGCETFAFKYIYHMGQRMRFWYLTCWWAAKALTSLGLFTILPELALLAYTKCGCRWKFRLNYRPLAPSWYKGYMTNTKFSIELWHSKANIMSVQRLDSDQPGHWSGLEVIKLFSCSTQLSTKFILLNCWHFNIY